MEPLIYYPTFEPPSETWLKFSLLYFENFKPIVPYERQHLLSDNFRRIQNETDLVTLFNPSHQLAYRASLHAIEEAEKIIEDVHARSFLFGKINVLRDWQNPDKWNFLVYGEKFSPKWTSFCLENRLGRRTRDGLLMPEELAFLFMTYLAKEIAFTESAALITDNNRFDNFTNYTRFTKPTIDTKTKFAKGLFNLIVPKDLNEIPFEKLIRFRNQNRHLLQSFNSEIDNVQMKISEGYTHRDFIESYNNIYSEFSREVLSLGLGISSIPFAAYMLIHNPKATSPEYIKEILGSLGLILGGGYALNKVLKDTQTRRYCKKYITNLERLR